MEDNDLNVYLNNLDEDDILPVGYDVIGKTLKYTEEVLIEYYKMNKPEAQYAIRHSTVFKELYDPVFCFYVLHDSIEDSAESIYIEHQRNKGIEGEIKLPKIKV